MLPRGALALALVVVLPSCGSPGSKQVDETTQTVSSWGATAQMVAEAWVRGALPTRYARNAIRKAQEQVQSAVESLNASPADARTSGLVRQCQQLELQLTGILAAFDRRDGDTVLKLAVPLAEAVQHLRQREEILRRQ